MNNIQIFENPEFGQVRVFLEDGEPLFVGVDVANILGYKEPHKAIVRHVDDCDRMKRPVSDNQGFIRDSWVINESGLYTLIFSSELLTAKSFKKWVTSEVLPSIRKTGSYSVKPMTQAELLLQQAKVIVDLEKRQQKQEGEIQRLTEENEEIRKDFDYLKSKTNNTPDYYSIVGYCSLKGISINLEDAKKLGKEASKICKANGLSVGSLPDPRFGRINTYPYSLLENIVNKSVKKVVKVK
nr:MAG TPA: repressor domain protein [Caudoviricetes sp.]